MISSFSDLALEDIFAADTLAMDDVRAILFRWAGVDDVNPNSRGEYVNAQELGFLETMMGQPFLQQGYRSDPLWNAGADLTASFDLNHNHYFAILAAQTEAGEIFTGDFYYNIATDSVVGITGLNTDVLDALEATAYGLANTAARELLWSNVVRVIEYTVGVDELETGDLIALGNAINGSDPSLNTGDIMELIVGEPVLNAIDGTSGAETLAGTGGADYIRAYGGDDIIDAGAGNDEVYAGHGSDTITGGAGSDYLSGDYNGDTYIYNPGDGVDIIDDAGGTTGDQILFGAGIDAGDVTLTRVGRYDLEITIDNGVDVGQIVISNQFGNYGAIETIAFDDTTTIDLTTMSHAQYGTAADDLLYGVTEGGSPDDELHGGDGNDTINAYNGDNIVYGDAGNDKIYAGSGNDIIYGGDGDDYIDGGSGDNVFYTGAGNDTVKSGDGDDTYYYTGGHDVYTEGWSSTDEIYLASGYTSGATVYYRINKDLKIVLDENNTITIKSFFHSTGYRIETLHFDGGPSVDLTAVTYVQQGDETDNTLTGTSGVDVFYGEAGNDTLIGNGGNDVLYGGTGDDSLNGGSGDDYLDGGAGDDYVVGYDGNDTFYYVSGHDTFVEDWSGTDKILMAEGWTFEDITFRRYADVPNNLVLELDSENSITISAFFQSTGRAVETLAFADESTYALTGAQYETHGTAGNDSIWGITYSGSIDDIIFGHDGDDAIGGSSGNDTLDGGGGDDHLDGGTGNDTLIGGSGDDLLEGYSGDDLYIYTSGHDTIYEYSGSNDVLRMGEGWTFEDITFRRYADVPNNLVLELDSENSITISAFFQSTGRAVETLAFADESTYALTGAQYETHGTAGNDSIWGITYSGSIDDIIFGHDGDDAIGGSSGNDTLDGGAGNDSLAGGSGADTLIGGAGDDYMDGGSGDDTYIYHSGLDTIYDYWGGTDTLWISNGVTINDITTSQSGSDAVIVVDSGTDEITITRQHFASSYYIENVTFDDGFITTLTDHLSWNWGTSGGDTLTGTSGHDTIIGKDGDDTINGAGGADNLHGGSGNDTLHGGDSSDLLHGGLGDDILFGDAGADTIFGGGGADAFMFEAATAYSGIDIIKDFNAGEGDVIDIADILDGIYDPMNDVLADFVQISESGGDTLLHIDRDGAGATYGWTQIASIQGVTGLEDADTMVAAGQLLAA